MPELQPLADHRDSINRLNRIRGQIEGIIRMIEEQRYCPDILTQTAAVKSAIKSVEMEILDRHLRHCVRDAMESGEKVDEHLRELDRVIKRFIS